MKYPPANTHSPIHCRALILIARESFAMSSPHSQSRYRRESTPNEGRELHRFTIDTDHRLTHQPGFHDAVQHYRSAALRLKPARSGQRAAAQRDHADWPPAARCRDRCAAAPCAIYSDCWCLSEGEYSRLARFALGLESCTAGECLVTFQSQATGAMRFQRLLTEMLTAQNLADDTDGLGQVDCWVFFRHCLFSCFRPPWLGLRIPARPH